jgi:hypothetical protein
MAKRLALTPQQHDRVISEYIVQSETVRGEPRRHWAETRERHRGWPKWAGPSRRTQRAAWIDAEYHVAGREADRPPCFAFTI